jgi:uncharacterized protein (TIGR02217 family)
MGAFVEERFNTEIRYGVVGGPEFNTTVVVAGNSMEQRNQNWAIPRGKWQCAQDLYKRKEVDWLLSFFRARRGRYEGFRFKDWADFDDGGMGWLIPTTGAYTPGSANGTAVYQMYKLYQTDGGSQALRLIKKPVSGTITITKNGVALAVAGIDSTTGLVTLNTPYPSGGELLRWTGEFDVPSRFDVDTFSLDFQGYDDFTKEKLFTISGLTIVELKQQ